ncbi:hypothetical protein [Weissella minor]|uniref:hypothetical protein n=1 Tax=Weissella minor TaxID=1620 RepID=UPI003AF280E3
MESFISSSDVSQFANFEGIPAPLYHYDKKDIGDTIRLFVNVAMVFPDLPMDDMTIELWSNDKKLSDKTYTFSGVLNHMDNHGGITIGYDFDFDTSMARSSGNAIYSFIVSINGASLAQHQKVTYDLKLVRNGEILDESHTSVLIVSHGENQDER